MMRFGIVLLAVMYCFSGCGGEDSAEADVVVDGGSVTADVGSPSDDIAAADAHDLDGLDAGVGCIDGQPCDDGDPCTADDICQSGQCTGGVNVVCDAEGPCREGSCDPLSGACLYADVTDGTACSVTCFGEAACQSGSCEAIADSAVQCPSPDTPCVEALGCDQATGECTVEIYRPEGTSCNTDEDVCSLETCDGAGLCVPTGEFESCQSENEENPCWTYVCNGKSGCAPTNFVSGASCDDNNPCTSNDTCGENEFGQETCLGTPVPIDDSNPCTDDACDEDGITHTPIDGAICDPQSPCSATGICANSLCEPITPCECLSSDDCPQPSSLCDGVAVCNTTGEVPVCEIEPASVVTCEPPTLACHTNTCNPFTGFCEELPIVDGTPCSDGNACTTDDACLAGACVGGAGVQCDDTLFCNGVESCDAALGCQPGVPPELDDGVDCTVDSCNEETDAPVHTPNDALCDNALFCDGAELCAGAAGCQPGVAPDPSDGVMCTADSCDESADTMVHIPNDAYCDNGAFCDGAETCHPSNDCQPGPPPEVDDGVVCTIDGCDESQDTVTHTPDDALCNDDDVCTLDSCATAGCTTTPAPPNTSCDDGLLTTNADMCDASGDCVGTPYTCEPTQCEATSTHNGTDCDVTYEPEGTACDDGDATTDIEECDGEGTCALPASTCGDGVQEGVEECDDENTETEVCDYGQQSCTVCDATCVLVAGVTSGFCGDEDIQTAFGESCDDGGTVSGDGCSATCELESVERSCLDIKHKDPSATDGNYTIDPDGAGSGAAFQVFCDMTTDGGGWTLVSKWVHHYEHPLHAPGTDAGSCSFDNAYANFDDECGVVDIWSTFYPLDEVRYVMQDATAAVGDFDYDYKQAATDAVDGGGFLPDLNGTQLMDNCLSNNGTPPSTTGCDTPKCSDWCIQKNCDGCMDVNSCNARKDANCFRWDTDSKGVHRDATSLLFVRGIQGCADGSIEGGVDWWGRSDIVFCQSADNSIPSSVPEAQALCANGWPVCTAEQFMARNDDCVGGNNFSGVIDSGNNCMVHDEGNIPGSWWCQSDTVGSGSCQGLGGSLPFAMMAIINGASAGAKQGALCCLPGM